ncbi:MAG: hypothetical protein HS100_12125 [Anaerolineales bacterium]|nr:hypothetical protein [Anaerolineales bacterium]
MKPSTTTILVKTTLTHTVTYFLMGLAALFLLGYTDKYADPAISILMRQTTDPLVAAGPLFQVIRGMLFGLVVFLMRDLVLERKRGWLTLWAVLVIVGVISPFGAAPSSIEGMIYTTLPLWFHINGLPEVLLQSLLLAGIATWWIDHAQNKWLGWLMGVIFIVIILLGTAGVLAGLGILQA